MRRIASILIEKYKQGPLMLSVPGLALGGRYKLSALLVNEILEDGVLGQVATKKPSGLWGLATPEKSVFVPFTRSLHILDTPDDIQFIHG